MFLKVFTLSLFSLLILEGENKWYSKFLETMYEDKGVRFNASIDQKQFDLSSEVLAYVEVVDSRRLLIEIDQETIVLSGDTIKTYNKETSQLIIDKLIDNDVGIFSLLSGNMREVNITKAESINNIIRINFSLLSQGYNGFIDILKSGEPKRMRLSYSNDQFIDITITNFEIGNIYKYYGFNPNPKEIINLYE